MKKTITYKLLALTSLFPVFASAALEGVKGLLGDFKKILDLMFPVMFALGLVYFFWGVGQFILNDAGNDKSREEGKKKMVWGVVALFVMFSIMGILSTISGLTGIPTTVTGSNSNSNPISTTPGGSDPGCENLPDPSGIC